MPEALASWAATKLEEARCKFRAHSIDEIEFRGALVSLGYSQYGVDREVEIQLLRLCCPWRD